MKKVIFPLIFLVTINISCFAETVWSVNSGKHCMRLIEKLNLNSKQAFSLIAGYRGNLEAIPQSIYKSAANYPEKDDENSLFTQALIAEMLADRRQAIEHLNECLKKNPKNDRCYYARARIHRDSGESKKAIQDFEKAIQINPKIAYLYHGRSILHKRNANFRNAANDFRKFINFASGSPFDNFLKEVNCFNFSLRDIKVKGCPAAKEYRKVGKWGKIRKTGELKRRTRRIPKECCEWECETFQTKCCEDWECTDYNPDTAECINWKCNRWVDCTKERCRCVELCGENE